jgi:hypothetical protein
MGKPKFIKTKFVWGYRYILPNFVECIEDKRANGGVIEIWRGDKMLMAFENMRAAKKFLRGLGPMPKEAQNG